MDGNALKKGIAKLIEKKGPDPVQVALITAGLGLSTVQKIIKGVYDPGPRARKVMAEVIDKLAS